MADKIKPMDGRAGDSLDRRSTIKTMALGGVALFVGGVGAAPAAAQCPQIACVQEGWRWCAKCQGMFYALATASQGGMGVCPGGGAHVVTPTGFHYYERVGASVANVQQGGWSWCAKCMGFFYSLASSGMGACPAGARHINAGSPAYAAVLGGNAVGQQGGWRWCSKCMGMFYSLSSGTQGVCPAGGAHSSAGSGQYASLN